MMINVAKEAKKLRDNRNAEMYALYKSGVKQAEISRRTGICYRHVKRIIDRMRKADCVKPKGVM